MDRENHLVGEPLATVQVRGTYPVRNLSSAALLVLILILTLATNSFATPIVAQSSVFPEPGLLALLGGGLLGLAALIRRHFSE
jgi:hypothetical protein